MTPRQIKLALKSLAALLVVGAGASLATALLLPIPDHTSSESDRTNRVLTTAPAPHRPLDFFASAWTAPLRQPLADLPPSPDRPALASDNASANASNNAPVALIGTIGDSLALLRASDGSVILKAVGESAGGAEIIAIRPFEVDLRVNGSLTTLRKPTDLLPPPPGRSERNDRLPASGQGEGVREN